MKTFIFSLTVLLLTNSAFADPQGELAKIRTDNLRQCLTGMYPSLCNRNLLTPDELAKVTAAERSHNLNTCLQGNYPTLCKHV